MFDYIIVGGGSAGCVLAVMASLSLNGWKINTVPQPGLSGAASAGQHQRTCDHDR